MSRISLRKTAPTAYSAFMDADRAINESPLPALVRELVKIRVSQLNGCVYCVDQHVRQARQLGESELRIHHLTAWRESPLFDERERAALEYAEVTTTPAQVSDELWESLKKQFSDAELGNLVALTALINAFNRFGIPLRMPPASTPITGNGE